MKANTNVRKASLRLTAREYRLIILLAVIIELFLSGYYFLMPKWTEYNALHEKSVSLIKTAETAQKDYVNGPKLIEQDKQKQTQLNELKLQLPTYISQENIILELTNTSRKTNLMVDTLTFGESSIVSSDDFLKKSAGNANPQKQPDLTKTPVIKNQDVMLSFSGSYKAMYDFIKSLEDSKQKIAVKDLTVMRTGENAVKGTLKISYLAYSEPGDKDTYTVDVPDINNKDNIFIPYEGYIDGSAPQTKPATQVKVKDPDFYIILNKYTDNAQKVIMGMYSKTGTEVYSEVNASVKGKFSIVETGSKLTATYTIGNTTKTYDAVSAPEDGILRLKVQSLPKENKDDKVGIKLDIENKTHYRLEISDTNDNKDAPRFVPGIITGTVSIVK